MCDERGRHGVELLCSCSGGGRARREDVLLRGDAGGEEREQECRESRRAQVRGLDAAQASEVRDQVLGQESREGCFQQHGEDGACEERGCDRRVGVGQDGAVPKAGFRRGSRCMAWGERAQEIIGG